MKRFLVFFLLIIAVISAVVTSYIYVRVFPKKYNNYIEKASIEYSVDSMLIRSIIKTESQYNEFAVSKAGAKGLMQLTDKTANWCAAKMGYSVYDIFDAETNIDMGTYYLSYLLSKYNGNERLAVAAYNAGHGRVDEWIKNTNFDISKSLNAIPYKETRNYIRKVEFYKKVYEFIFSHSL